MPEQPAVAKQPAAVAPSQNWFQRTFGTTPMTPNMQQGIDIARKENPNLAPVESYGPISRLLNSGANAYVGGGNSIYVNPANMGSMNPQQVADTLAHEQTHINQKQGTSPTMNFLRAMFSGPRGPHYQRPDEMEAYQVEAQRRARMGRPAEPRQNMFGQTVTPQDVNLPAPRKSVAPSMGSPMYQSARSAKTM